MRKGSHLSEEQKLFLSELAKGRIPWNKGVPASDAQKLNQSLKMKGRTSPRKGVHLSDETKQKLREYNLGNKASDETKQKMKAKSWKTKGLQSPSANPSEETRLKMRQNILNRSYESKKPTRPEVMMREELSRRGYAYYINLSIEKLTKPDATFPDIKVAVYTDGIYWHNIPKVKARDERNNAILPTKGWIVIRFWETEVYTNVEACVDEIEDILISRMKEEKHEPTTTPNQT